MSPKPYLPLLAAVLAMPSLTQTPRAAELPQRHAAGVTAATAAAAAGFTEIGELLEGSRFPLSIGFSSLTPEYRRFVLSSQEGGYNFWLQLPSAPAGGALDVYFTKGETVQVNGETYLAAWKPGADYNIRLLSTEGARTPGALAKPAPSAMLHLSLLNLRTTGSFSDIRPFDRERDGLSAVALREATVTQLKRLGEAVQRYLLTGDDKLPPLNAAVALELPKALKLFGTERDLLINPATGEAFVPNRNASGLNFNLLENKKQLVLFAEDRPAADGRRAVLFADCHVERVDQARWTRIQAIQPAMRKLLPPAEVMGRLRKALEAAGLDAVSLDCGPGVLTISGAVDSQNEFLRITRIAREQAPGYQITNRLRVLQRPTPR